jgi:hypothetical protein
MDETKENEDFHKESSGCKLSIKLKKVFIFARIVAIAAIILWISLELLRPDILEPIGIAFSILLVFLAIVGRVIAFLDRGLSKLGFTTEIAFIFGIIFLLVNLWLGSSVFLAIFIIMSFIVSPLLGLINRVVKLKRGEAKSVGCSILEMIILGIPVVLATWILLKMK